MAKSGLSPKTIENYILVPKMVVTSVVDEDGNQVYPRKWDHEFVDMPIVEQTEHSFVFSEIMIALARYPKPREQIFSFSPARPACVTEKGLVSRSISISHLTVRRSA